MLKLIPAHKHFGGEILSFIHVNDLQLPIILIEVKKLPIMPA